MRGFLQFAALACCLIATDSFAQQNSAPKISDIPDQTIPVSSTTGSIKFTIDDVETPAAELRLTATSSDTRLVSPGNIDFSGAGNNRTVTVTPTPGLIGQALITVTVFDTGQMSARDSFLVTVTPPNTPPTISDIPDQKIDEDGTTGPIDFIIDDKETAPDQLSLSASSDNLSLVPVSNIAFGGSGTKRTVTVKPAPDQFGSALIVVTVSDGTASAPDRFLVTVSPVNDPPVISNIPDQTIDEDTATGPLPFTVTDIDSSQTAITVSASADNKTLVPDSAIALGGGPNGRTITITPASNENGSALITIIASDGQATSSKRFVLTVNPVNDPPTINRLVNLTLNEDDPAQTVALAGISFGQPNENQTLTVTATSDNPALITNPTVNYTSPNATGFLSFAPAPNAHGQATITVTVNDGGSANNTASAIFFILVNPVDDPPTLDPISNVTIDENAPTQLVNLTGISSGASDENQTLIVTAASDSAAVIPNPAVNYTSPNSTGTLLITPVPNANGSASITVTVNDGSNNTTSRTFRVIVNPVNHAPTISDIPNQAVDQDTSLAPVAFTVDDIDNSPAALIVTAKSGNQTLVPDANISLGGAGANRTIAIRPASGQSGNTIIIVEVSDGSAAAADIFLLAVNKRGSPPTIVNHPLSQTVDEGTDVSFKVDAAGDLPLTYQWRFNQTPMSGQIGSHPNARKRSTRTIGTLRRDRHESEWLRHQ